MPVFSAGDNFGSPVVTEATRKSTFEKTVIGFVGVCTVAAMVAALRYPPASVTLSPQAEFRLEDPAFETAPGAASALVRGAKPDGAPLLTVSTLDRTFAQLGYDLDRLRDGDGLVPRHFVAAMPSDMRAIRVPAKRKALFIKTVLPLILQANDEIRADRARLERILEHKGDLPAVDRLWLAAKAEVYEVERADLTGLRDRMDVIPPSLAIAQAAEESGWGTSRFVLEGNALFGQWTFSRNRHMVPRGRAAGRSHQVQAFPNLIEGVRAYMENLNTHRAYRRFRDFRSAQRAKSQPLHGLELAATLANYSERREKYVETIQGLIRFNRLQALDGARLGVATASRRPAEPAI